VATDIDTRFLQEIHEPNFEAWKHDITIDDLPPLFPTTRPPASRGANRTNYNSRFRQAPRDPN